MRSTPISSILSGEKAFYNQPHYLETTKKELSQAKLLPSSYTWNTEHKIIRLVKQFFTILIFPIGIYKLIHGLVGRKIVLASHPTQLGYAKNHAQNSRSHIDLSGEWQYKRLTVEVDGHKIDVVIWGKKSTLDNGKWVLVANGANKFYEDGLLDSLDFKQMLTELKGNAIVFNYPSVGASSGLLPNKQAMVKAHRAILNFLEDSQKGIGAKEIIFYVAETFGTAIQAEALRSQPLPKEGTKQICLKNKPVAELIQLFSNPKHKRLVSLIKFFNWNVNVAEASKELKMHEIILQTARVTHCEQITNSAKIIDDVVIPAHSSLAKVLLEDKEASMKNKTILGSPHALNTYLSDPLFLAKTIQTHLT